MIQILVVVVSAIAFGTFVGNGAFSLTHTGAPTSSVGTQVEEVVAATPTPTPAGPCNADKKKTVGIQVGHWKAAEAPDELETLRWNTGTEGGGHSEWEVMYDIAERAKGMLEDDGITVDLLPTTIPQAYCADLFISLHADGNEDVGVRGYKAVASLWSGPEAEEFADTLEQLYGASTKLPQDGAISDDMRQYYAFNFTKFLHSIDPDVPAVILETGFLSNVYDRDALTRKPDNSARAIAQAVESFLKEHSL